MKKSLPIIAGLVLLLSLAAGLLLRPALWQEELKSYFNQRLLNPTGWELLQGDLAGHLLTGVSARGVEIIHRDGSTLSIGILRARPNLLTTLRRGLDLAELSLEQFHYAPAAPGELPVRLEIEGDTLEPVPAAPRETLQLPARPDLEALLTPAIRIDRIHLEGEIDLTALAIPHRYTIALNAQLDQQDERLNLFLEDVSIQELEAPLQIAIQEAQITVTPQGLSLAPLYASLNNFPFHGTLDYSWSEGSLLKGDLYTEDYRIPELLFEQTSLPAQFSSLNARIQLESDLRRYSGEIDVSNNLGLDMQGQFEVQTRDDHLALEGLDLRSGETHLSLQGIYEPSGRINGTLTLTSLDVSQWLEKQPATQLNGFVIYEGILEQDRVSALEVSLELEETILFPAEDVSLSGSLVFQEDRLEIINPLTLTIGPSYVTVQGWADLAVENLDLSLELHEAAVFLINNFWSDSLSSGTATGNLHLVGAFDTPGVEASLVCDQIGFRNTHLDHFDLDLQVDQLSDSARGYLRMNLGSGRWKEHAFNSGTLDLRLRPLVVEIVGLELQAGDDFLIASGHMEGDTLHLEHVQLAYRDHYLTNPVPLRALVRPAGIEIKPFEVHIDDGIVSGFLSTHKGLEGRLKFSNVDAGLVDLLYPAAQFTLRGLAFGELVLLKRDGVLDVSLNGTLKNGALAQQQFDDLTIATFYRDDILHIEELTLIHGEKTGLRLEGIIPFRKGLPAPRDIMLQADLKRIDLQLLTDLVPEYDYLGGIVSGRFNLGGNTARTRFDFDLVAAEAVFDRVRLGSVQGRGRYDGKRLNLDHFSARRPGNRISGEGFLPIDFNLGSDEWGAYYQQDSLWIQTSGDLRDLAFLTVYLADIDSVTGEFEVQLSLRGTPERVIRDGRIQVRDGAVYSILLDDPIQNVAAEAVLRSNQFQIQSFQGTMVDPTKKKRTPSNLQLSGSMDLTRFFEPDFDLKVQGEDIYFRTLLGDIEGRVDLDLQVTGKDTITIAGEIAPLEGVMYQEFTTTDIGQILGADSRITTNYQVNFPIKGDFALKNSQIDAWVRGEITITQRGLAPADYGGEIRIQEGKFYYGQDVFEQLKGTLVFDGQGFNPYLDISASTSIGEEEINLVLIGEMENPQLFLESSSGFSQEDILELLTFHKRFEDQEMTPEGIGAQVNTILNAYVESQFEKNLLRLSGLDQTGWIEDVTISGTAGLIDPAAREDFSIRARLSEKMSIAYRRSFSFSNAAYEQVGVEYKLNPYFSMVGNMDEKGEFHMKLRLRNSY